MDKLLDNLKGFFSWVVLAYLSIIFSGIFLGQFLCLSDTSNQWLRFRIPYVNIEARGNQVIWGITSFVITTVIIAIFPEPAFIDRLVTIRFGIEIAHFHALCFVSSITTLICAVVLFFMYKLSVAICSKLNTNKQNRHKSAIDKVVKNISKKQEDEQNSTEKED